MTKSYKERREKLRKDRQEKDKEEEQEPTTTSTRTINIEGREVPVRFPIVFESKTPDEILHRRFTIKEPDSNGKVNVYCEAMDEDLMHRLMDVMAELMDKCGVKNFNITTREHLAEDPEGTGQGFIPIPFHRTQIFPLDDTRYNNLREFFNAMVTEYKHRIENNELESDHALVTYHEKENNRIQGLYLFPTKEQMQAGLLDRFVLSFCRQHQPKYLFRMHGALIDENTKEGGFVFMAEDRDELLTKKFRVIKNPENNIMTLVEVSSERSACDEDPNEAMRRWHARYGKDKDNNKEE